MALMKQFLAAPTVVGGMHRTSVDCYWKSFEAGGSRILQLDTFGSEERQIPGKLSQTLRLDEEQARRLVNLIDRVFPAG
jgi:hypothetical protein